MEDLLVAGPAFMSLGAVIMVWNRALARLFCVIGRGAFRGHENLAPWADGLYEPERAADSLRVIGALSVLQGLVLFLVGLVAWGLGGAGSPQP